MTCLSAARDRRGNSDLLATRSSCPHDSGRPGLHSLLVEGRVKRSPIKRASALKRSRPKPRKRLKWWPERSKTVRWLALDKCQSGSCRNAATQTAHIHPLGAGRSRDNPDERCSQCGLLLNSLFNLLAVCSSACNTAVSRPCPGKNNK